MSTFMHRPSTVSFMLFFSVTGLCLALPEGAGASVCRDVPRFDCPDSCIPDCWDRYLEEYRGQTTTSREYPFDQCFNKASAEHSLPKTLLVAIARGESLFDKRAKSSANALGVMQIRWPVTARHLNIYRKEDLYDPCINIDAGARYMVEMIGSFDRLHTALVAYNRGPHNVRRDLERTGRFRDPADYGPYIYYHLKKVLRGEERSPSTRFDVPRLLTLASFDKPFRARDLLEHIENGLPQYQFEWRRRQDYSFDDVKFEVNLLYHSTKELEDAKKELDIWGLR